MSLFWQGVLTTLVLSAVCAAVFFVCAVACSRLDDADDYEASLRRQRSAGVGDVGTVPADDPGFDVHADEAIRLASEAMDPPPAGLGEAGTPVFDRLCADVAHREAVRFDPDAAEWGAS